MFIALNSASPKNKYQITWVELPYWRFEQVIGGWFGQLKSFPSGPPRSQRKALANEFCRLLYVQWQLLKNSEPQGAKSMELRELGRKVRFYKDYYQQTFNSPMMAPSGTDNELQRLVEKRATLTAKLRILDRKLKLINYWIHGVEHFPKHREGNSLMFQYMGNAPSEKVRLFMEVVCKDAEKVAVSQFTLQGIKSHFNLSSEKGLLNVSAKASFESKHAKASSELQLGLQTAGDGGKLHKFEWTNDEFKKAIKAEIGAGFGATYKGKAELEFTGFKAGIGAEAFAGARTKAEGELSWGVGSGATAKGEVEAEIGVKLTFKADIDCADIFLCEASAEAFAGAMAKAEIEITAKWHEVTIKVGAEAFAGARLKGEAKMTFRLQGYEIISGKATGALTAGIGAKFEMEIGCTLFGGGTLKLEAGTTYGLGAEAGAEFKIRPDHLGLAFHSLYYTSHLMLLGEKKKAETWKKYFRELEDNKKLFLRGRVIIERHMTKVILERNQLFREYSQWKQLEVLSEFRQIGTV